MMMMPAHPSSRRMTSDHHSSYRTKPIVRSVVPVTHHYRYKKDTHTPTSDNRRHTETSQHSNTPPHHYTPLHHYTTTPPHYPPHAAPHTTPHDTWDQGLIASETQNDMTCRSKHATHQTRASKQPAVTGAAARRAQRQPYAHPTTPSARDVVGGWLA